MNRLQDLADRRGQFRRGLALCDQHRRITVSLALAGLKHFGRQCRCVGIVGRRIIGPDSGVIGPILHLVEKVSHDRDRHLLDKDVLNTLLGRLPDLSVVLQLFERILTKCGVRLVIKPEG